MAFELYKMEKASRDREASQRYSMQAQQSQDAFNFKMTQLNQDYGRKMANIQGKYQLASQAINVAANLGMAAMQNYYQLRVSENQYKLQTLKLQGDMIAQESQLALSQEKMGMARMELDMRRDTFLNAQADRLVSHHFMPLVAKFNQEAGQPNHSEGWDYDTKFAELQGALQRIQTDVSKQAGGKIGILDPTVQEMYTQAGMLGASHKYKLSDGTEWYASQMNDVLSNPQNYALETVTGLSKMVNADPSVPDSVRKANRSWRSRLLQLGPTAYGNDDYAKIQYSEFLAGEARRVDEGATESVLKNRLGDDYTVTDRIKDFEKILGVNRVDPDLVNLEEPSKKAPPPGVADVTKMVSVSDHLATAAQKLQSSASMPSKVTQAQLMGGADALAKYMYSSTLDVLDDNTSPEQMRSFDGLLDDIDKTGGVETAFSGRTKGLGAWLYKWFTPQGQITGALRGLVNDPSELDPFTFERSVNNIGGFLPKDKKFNPDELLAPGDPIRAYRAAPGRDNSVVRLFVALKKDYMSRDPGNVPSKASLLRELYRDGVIISVNEDRYRENKIGGIGLSNVSRFKGEPVYEKGVDQ